MASSSNPSSISSTPTEFPWTAPAGASAQRVLAADPDLLLQRVEGAPVELMEEMLFQAIGSLELITIMRDYSFDGQKVFYQPIINLEDINRQYNPHTITSPTFNFANWRRIHSIVDVSHITDSSPDSVGPVRLETTAGQVNVAVVLPGLSSNQRIEVAISYSPQVQIFAPEISGEDLIDGGDSVVSLFGRLVDGGTSVETLYDLLDDLNFDYALYDIDQIEEQIICGSSKDYYATIDGSTSAGNFMGYVDGGNSLGYNIDRIIIGDGA